MSRWPLVPLREVLVPVSRPAGVDATRTYRVLGTHWYAGGLYIKDTLNGSQIRATKVYRVEEGDFVYNRLFAWKGSFALATREHHGCYVSNEFPCFRANTERLDAEYLLKYLSRQSAWAEALDLSAGGTPTSRNRLKEESFLAMSVPLPPLRDQQRLVNWSDAFVQKIDEATRLRAEASLAAAALQSQYAGQLIFNERWPTVSIEELVGRANLRNGKSLKAAPTGSAVRCLTLSSMRDGRIDTRDTKPVPMTLSEAEPFLVRHGDVFLVRGNGSKEFVGRAGIAEQAPENLIFPDLLIRVPLDNRRILPRYFVHVWNSPQIRARIEDLARTTSGIWKVNQGHIASMSIPLPPVGEQDRVIGIITQFRERMSSISALQKRSRVEIERLLASLLDRTFAGEQ